MLHWHLVYRLELSGTVSRPVATAWTCALASSGSLSGCLHWLICSLAAVSRAVLEFGAAAFKSVTGLPVASCALFVCFGSCP